MILLKTFNMDILIYCAVMFAFGLDGGHFFAIKQMQVYISIVLLSGILAIMFSCEKRGLVNVE
jgi:hypothetical protein